MLFRRQKKAMDNGLYKPSYPRQITAIIAVIVKVLAVLCKGQLQIVGFAADSAAIFSTRDFCARCRFDQNGVGLRAGFSTRNLPDYLPLYKDNIRI